MCDFKAGMCAVLKCNALLLSMELLLFFIGNKKKMNQFWRQISCY